MNNFTYEENECGDKLEDYEWDNVWIDHARDPVASRILYIGDSISCGSRRVATATSKESLLFDGFGTSKALDNPYFKDAVKLFAMQEVSRKAVIFNNGLHGWHLDDETEYRYFYEEMIKFLLSEFEGVPVAIVLTTHVRNKEREKRVIVRNKVATELASQYGLPVIDLYAVSKEYAHLLFEDGVHFTNEGYEKLAGEIVDSVHKILQV